MPLRHEDERTATRVKVRPTLIIGLGGTGSLGCQYAHDGIINACGKVPPFVSFVSFDTDAQEEGGPRRKLPASDVVDLFNDFQLGEVVRDYKRAKAFHPHLNWLADMELDAGAAGRGCQGMSRLGRVVLFERRTDVRKAVITRLELLNSSDLSGMAEFRNRYELQPGSTPVIHIITSVCGGTGSGLLLDLAYNLRWWTAETFQRQPDIVAHLVLPEAFPVDSPRIKDKLRAVAVSTLEQIEFLMDHRRESLTVRYRDGEVRQLEPLQAPFDYCFLLSGASPAGGNDRRNLTRMIGRMIQSMTVEPASKPIFADANNKQLDILTQFEPANGRKLCFSSYGLRCGAPGFETNSKRTTPASNNGAKSHDARTNDAKVVWKWICETLGRLTSAPPANVAAEVDTVLAECLDPRKLAEMMAHISPFRYQAPPPTKTQEQHLRETVQSHIDQLLQKCDDEAKKVVPETVPALVRQRIDEAQAASARGENPADTFYGVLVAWEQHLERLTRERTPDEVSPAVVARQISEEAVRASRAAAAGSDAAQAKAKIEEAVQAAVQGQLESLQLACLRGRRIAALDKSRRHAEQLRIMLGDLGLVAQEELRLATRYTDWSYDVEPLSVALCRFENPAVLTAESAAAIRRQYFEELIRPILEEYLKAQPRSLSGSREICGRLREEKADAFRAFLAEYRRNAGTEFHSKHPQGAAHPLYPRIEEIFTGASAQIAINHSRRFTDPLDVTISQHTENSCAPSILEALVGRAYRDAFTEPEQENGVWVQLMRFAYGFSLESLNSYNDYKDSSIRYLERTRLNPQDLWLEPKWHHAYQECLQKWRSQVAKPADASSDGQRLAERQRELEEQVHLFWTGLQEAAGQHAVTARLVPQILRSTVDALVAVRVTPAGSMSEFDTMKNRVQEAASRFVNDQIPPGSPARSGPDALLASLAQALERI